MRDPLERALRSEPWSMAELLFGLSHVLDDEGRPIAERRAPSAVKKGVDIELEACPYHDERRGGVMNVSALEQIKKHLRSVFTDAASFHATLDPSLGGWTPMALAVIDQLSGPGRHLLSGRDPAARVPASIAVGYKLAAGYFDVVRRLLARELVGDGLDPSVDTFLAFVHSENALVGQGEVCAGPPKLIRRTTHVLFHGDEGAAPLAHRTRVAVAAALLDQVRLGAAWRRFDEAAEAALLRPTRHALVPANAFFARALSGQLEALDASETGALPWSPPLEVFGSLAPTDPRRAFLAALAAHGPDPAPDPELEGLPPPANGALRFATPAAALLFARSMRTYVEAYRRLLGAQWSLEQGIRAALGLALDAPMKLHGLLAPAPLALRWLQAGLGLVLRCEPSADPVAELRRGDRTVRVSAS